MLYLVRDPAVKPRDDESGVQNDESGVRDDESGVGTTNLVRKHNPWVRGATKIELATTYRQGHRYGVLLVKSFADEPFTCAFKEL
jgi:hypothetical protein